MNDELFNRKLLFKAVAAALIIAGAMILIRSLMGGNINLWAIELALIAGGATSYLGVICLIGWTLWKESPGSVIIGSLFSAFIVGMTYLFNYN